MQVSTDQRPSGLPLHASGAAGAMGVPKEVQAALLAGMRRKDRQAFTLVIQNFSHGLTKAAYLYLGDGHDAEDAVQETFLAAWDAARRTSDLTNLSHWLFGILMNRCRKHIRSTQRRRKRDRQAVQDRLASGAPAGPEDAGKLIALQSALTLLSPKHREVVILRYYEGLSVDATGEAMGIPPGTVKSRCHVALSQLRSIIGASS